MLTAVFDLSSYALNLYAFPVIFVGLLIFVTGFVVSVRERWSVVSVTFLLVTISTAFWLVFVGVSYMALDEKTALFWIRVEHFGVTLIPSAVFFFCLAIIRRFEEFQFFAWVSLLVSALFYAAVLFTDSFVKRSPYLYPWGYYASYGPLSLQFLGFFALMFIVSLRLLWKEYRRTVSHVHKTRLKVFLTAFIFALIAVADFAPTFGVAVYPLGFLPVLFFFVIAAWCIWRFRLVDLTPEFAANQILETMKGAVFVVDMDGDIRIVNRAACNMLAYGESELIGRPIGTFFKSYSVENVETGNETTPQGILHDHIMQWRTKDGREIYVSVSTSPVPGRDGLQVGVVYVALDITKLKLIQEEMKKTENFLNSIVENIPDMIFVKDAKELRFVSFNKAGEELIGLSRESMIGKNDYDFFPKEQADFFTTKDREVLAGKKLEDIPEEPIQTKSKGERALHTKKIPILDEKGNPRYLLGISEDITEYKEAQKKLLEKTAELARSIAEREQLQLFTYVASHDLREPLQKVIGFGDLLMGQCYESLSEKGRDYLDRMQNATIRMSQLIEDILKFSRITTEEENLESSDLNEVVKDVLFDLELSITESKGSVELGVLPVLNADKTQMHQLFQNLIANALKFHKKDESPLVRIKGRNLGNSSVEITVEDNGIGFDEKYLEKIFKPFERLHGRSEYKGSGIGLAICQKIVQRHKGQITARSAPGQGAVFIITLPLA